MKLLKIDALHEAHTAGECETLKVSELKALLDGKDESAPVVLAFGDGTYGGLRPYMLREVQA